LIGGRYRTYSPTKSHLLEEIAPAYKEAFIQALYSMAKAGIHAFTQHLAMELADARIRVNAIGRPELSRPPVLPLRPIRSIPTREGGSHG
jgi:hypothetical protein